MKILLLALFLSFPVHALTIDTKLIDFQKADTTVNSGGPYGGIGLFELYSDVTGTEVDFLGSTFYAQCLEWDEPIRSGRRYQFDVVPLAQAPTSTGGMGTTRATWVDRILTYLGYGMVDDIVAAGPVAVSAVQGVLYEAGYESLGNPFDRSGNDIIIGGSGMGVGGLAAVANSPAPDNVISYALLNQGNPFLRTVPRLQDFVVFTPDLDFTIPEPTPLIIIGLGLLLIVFLRGKHVESS